MDFRGYKREMTERKLIMKLQEAEEAVIAEIAD